jgi:hypothetical protein
MTPAEKINARRREYYWANREKKLAQAKASKARNKAQVLAAAKAYREANREKVNAKVAEWGAKNKDKKKAIDVDWRSRNKEHCVAISKKWAQANPQKVDLAKTKHYLAARLNVNPATLPVDLIEAQAALRVIRRTIKNALS